MPRALLVYGSAEGQTHKIEEVMAEDFRAKGWETEVVDAKHPPRDLAIREYDAVVVGASIHVGKHPDYMVEFVKNNKGELEQRPSAFLSVSLSAAGDENEQADARKCLIEFLEQTEWTPKLQAIVAGALRYRDYNILKRFLMRKVMEKGGHDTDTSRNHEYTDWRQVHNIVDEITGLVS